MLILVILLVKHNVDYKNIIIIYYFLFLSKNKIESKKLLLVSNNLTS